MTLNYNTNRKELEEAYKRVTESADGDKWVIYDYEGNSNTLKVGEEGVGGLDDFSTSFSSGKLQFGVIAVRLSSDVIPKIVLIHWQGEGVPTLRLASTTSHAEEFRRFLKSVHIVLHARSEIDVEPDIIRKEVLKLPAANTSANVESSYSVPEKVESVYRPVKPQAELSSTARDDFWNKMNDEEKKRQNEEKKLRDVQQKKYEEDRKRTANEIHSQAESYQPEKVTSVYKPVKPHVELKSSQREEFWNKMNEEEKKRQEEERKLREAQQKQFEADRQRTAQEIHSQAESYQPDKVTSVYKPVKPHVELNSSAREEFWSKMNEEEKRRVEEEKIANEAKKKQFEEDHRRISNDIHAKLQIQQETISSEAEKKENGTKPIVITGGLVGSRKEIFNNKDSEPLAPLPKSISNSGGVKKWPPVSTNQNDNESVPINRFDKNENSKTESIPAAPEEPRHVYKPEVMVPTPAPTYNNSYNEAAPTEHAPAPPPPEPTPTKYLSQYDSPPVFEAPEAQEVAPSYYSSQYDAVPELPPSEPENYGYVSKKAEENVPAHIASQYDMPPVLPEESIPSAQIDRYDFPPTIEASNDQKALALWDYQAADDTEISFDPDDIITEIDQVDSGWWKGKAPNGRIGLFPANYVKLL